MRPARFFRASCLGLLLATACNPPDPARALARESAEVLERDPVVGRAEVRHVLIGWDALAPAYGDRMDERARSRSRAEAEALAWRVLSRARASASSAEPGEDDFEALMHEFSEDWASAQDGRTYVVHPGAQLVAPFISLSLRLLPDEVAAVESQYGWHVIQRVR